MLKVHAKILEAVTVLSLRGQIVTGETEILRDIVQSLSGTTALILDLARVSKIDAHGLGVMLELREQAQTNGMRFELMNISQPLSGILELTHLDSVFQIRSGVGMLPAVSSKRRESLLALKPCA